MGIKVVKGKAPKITMEVKETKSTHCDDYAQRVTSHKDARWFIFIERLPASLRQLVRDRGIPDPVLYATHQGKRVRVTMASRFGDVGITQVLEAPMGYDTRVSVDELSDFSAQIESGLLLCACGKPATCKGLYQGKRSKRCAKDECEPKLQLCEGEVDKPACDDCCDHADWHDDQAHCHPIKKE